jgi:hypothetical protein
MAPEPAQHVTELLQAAQAGEPGAAEQLLNLPGGMNRLATALAAAAATGSAG